MIFFLDKYFSNINYLLDKSIVWENISVAKILGNAAVIPSTIFGKLESLCASRLGFDITFTYT